MGRRRYQSVSLFALFRLSTVCIVARRLPSTEREERIGSGFASTTCYIHEYSIQGIVFGSLPPNTTTTLSIYPANLDPILQLLQLGGRRGMQRTGMDASDCLPMRKFTGHQMDERMIDWEDDDFLVFLTDGTDCLKGEGSSTDTKKLSFVAEMSILPAEMLQKVKVTYEQVMNRPSLRERIEQEQSESH